MQITINNILCHSINDIKNCTTTDVANFIEEYFNELPYVIAYTSGSTGVPKEIHLFKDDLKASAQLTNDYFGLNEDSTFYLNLSPKYIAGKMMLVRAIIANANIIIEESSNQPLSKYSGEKRISLGAFVPSQIKYLINNPEKLVLFDKIIIGGGKIPNKIERWLAEQGIRAFSTYGMTETCSHIALAPVSTTTQPYTALGNITFSIDNRNCLIIHAPHFHIKEIVTNDIVELISPTQFVWCGRFDNVINTGGIKVFPEFIEPIIGEFITNVRFFITSQPSEKWGEELILALEYASLPDGVKKKGNIRPDFTERLKTRLPSHAIPKHYIAVKKFKETTTGKIIREL